MKLVTETGLFVEFAGDEEKHEGHPDAPIWVGTSPVGSLGGVAPHSGFRYVCQKPKQGDEMKRFSTPKEAFEWMEIVVDDPYVDNERFSYLDDEVGMRHYNEAVLNGYCGCFDKIVNVGGRMAKIGCNYGH